jgi:hypothetical protein
MTRLLLLLIACLLCASTPDAHRILGLFPHQGRSHFTFFHPIMRALAEAGHEVTVVSEFPIKEPIENYHDEALPTDASSGMLNAVTLDVSFAIALIKQINQVATLCVVELSIAAGLPASLRVFLASSMGQRGVREDAQLDCHQKCPQKEPPRAIRPDHRGDVQQ